MYLGKILAVLSFRKPKERTEMRQLGFTETPTPDFLTCNFLCHSPILETLQSKNGLSGVEGPFLDLIDGDL